MVQRCLIVRREEGIPLRNKMDQEIVSAINRELFHPKALAHIWIVNAKRNARGRNTAITQQKAMPAMALICRDVIIIAARTVGSGIIDIEENKSWERLTIDAVPLARYMGKGTECLEKMRDEIHAVNEGVAIPVQVLWLVSPHNIRERRQKGDITAWSVVFIVKGSKVAGSLLKDGFNTAVWWENTFLTTTATRLGRGLSHGGCREIQG